MLLNISNHPSHIWDKKQTEAAIQSYSEIVDIEFPQIDPECDIFRIMRLADEYLEIVQNKIAENPDTQVVVHLMGELTFCFSLAIMLASAEIQCIASTTRRNAIEKNGVKKSVFEFVKFRNYYDL
ncbi:MAG: CRISPR-associated protein [Bacteroidales bacterium]|nr:CRISPR-associated protein [Bacteroidales bacterium]